MLQAIAIVLGFLVFVGLIVLLVFAVKTRSKIRRWGEERILWEELKTISDAPRNSVGEWVSARGRPHTGRKHIGYDLTVYTATAAEGRAPRTHRIHMSMV